MKEVLFSSRMISMHSSTHSSQMKTVGPAMSFRTSCWLLPQKEQYSVFLDSPPLTLLIGTPRTSAPWSGPPGIEPCGLHVPRQPPLFAIRPRGTEGDQELFKLDQSLHPH